MVWPLIWLGLKVLSFVGFTKADVAGASIAAATQSTIGNVAAGSTFAAAQSAAALSSGAIATKVGVSTAAAGAAKCYIEWHWYESYQRCR
jgi:hypothetical protein